MSFFFPDGKRTEGKGRKRKARLTDGNRAKIQVSKKEEGGAVPRTNLANSDS